MDEIIKIGIYVVLGIIYLFFQANKKSKAEQQKRQKEMEEAKRQHDAKQHSPSPSVPKPVSSPAPQKPLITLEELLSEFGVEPPVQEAPKPAPATYVPDIVDYEENIEDEEIAAVRKIKEDIRAIEDLNKDRIPLPDEHLANYKPKKRNKEHRIASLLKRPQSVKDSVILAEVLKKKF